LTLAGPLRYELRLKGQENDGFQAWIMRQKGLPYVLRITSSVRNICTRFPKTWFCVKAFLIGGYLLLWLFFAIGITFYYFNLFYNRPWVLSGKTEVIEVSQVMWACDCADFIETKHFGKNPEYEPQEEDFIFIEAARPELKIPLRYYGKLRHAYKLRLTGQFYKDKGVSRTYEGNTSETPDRARVFRYDKFKIIKNR
jgi:hypothetical protein